MRSPVSAVELAGVK